MNSMNNIEINEDDLVIFPDGNNRFGGLYFTVGLVVGVLEKRVKVLCTKYPLEEKPKYRTTSKTPQKLLVLPDDRLFDASVRASLKANRS